LLNLIAFAVASHALQGWWVMKSIITQKAANLLNLIAFAVASCFGSSNFVATYKRHHVVVVPEGLYSELEHLRRDW
jgi:hypothetical protein